MLEYIDEHDIANTAMMMASAKKGAILIVEGLTDRRLYGKFADKDTQILVANSKHNVESAIRKLYEERKFRRAIGIIDSDLDKVNGRTVSAPLFFTDTRDSESMMLKSTALEDIVSEYSEPKKLEEYVEDNGSVRENVLRSAYPLGLLMLISLKNGLKLSFKNLDFDSFISRRDMSCNVRKMISEVVSKSIGTKQDPNQIRSLLKKEEEYDPWLICRGHDITAILAIGLKYVFGSFNAGGLNSSILGGSFRLAYDPADFRQTMLYQDSERWCSENDIVLWVRD